MKNCWRDESVISKLVVQSRLALINDCLKQLRRLSAVSRVVFVGDIDRVAATESYLRRALEAIFDVGRHILAKSGGADLATEYKSIAYGLGVKGVISPELVKSLVSMAGYRNRMVHLYHLVQEDELYEILQNDLGDLEAFSREVTAFANALEI